MTFAPHVERWRYLAIDEAPDLPPGLVLAVITRESNGRPGLVGSSGDLGLMQVNPGTLTGYNARNPPISFEQMTGKDAGAARLQVRAGVWVLRRALLAVHKLDPVRYPWPKGPPSDEQILKSDLVYAAGAGAVEHYRRRVLSMTGSDDVAILASYAPGPPGLDRKWQIPARKFGHGRAVLSMARADTGGGGGAPRPPVVVPQPSAGGGAVLLLAALLLAWGAARSRSARPRQA